MGHVGTTARLRSRIPDPNNTTYAAKRRDLKRGTPMRAIATMFGLISRRHQAAAPARWRPRSRRNASAARPTNTTGPSCALAIALKAGCDQRRIGKNSFVPPSIGQARASIATPPTSEAKSTTSHAPRAAGSVVTDSGAMAIAVHKGYANVSGHGGSRVGSCLVTAAHVVGSYGSGPP